MIEDVRLLEPDAEQILMQIAPCYAVKYKDSKIKKNAEQELLSGIMLKRCLGVNQDKQLTCNEFGKPFLVSGDKFFNLSHSDNYVVLAWGDSEVGVDIEKIRPYHKATAEKIFSTEQKAVLAELTGAARDRAFTKIWTECEAELKLKGTGFSEGWDKEKGPLEKCSIYSFEFDDCFISLATEEKVAVTVSSAAQ